MGAKPDKFVWPPKPLSEAEVGPPEDPSYWKKQPAREAPIVEVRPQAIARILDAERESKGVVESPVATQPCGQSSAWSWHEYQRHVETVWLGLTRATLAERAADVGWEPDPVWAYCSRCGGSVGMHEETGDGCRVCRGKRLPWSRFIRLGEYQGLVRDVVHEVKFTAWRRLGMDVGQLLGRQLVPLLEGVAREKLVLVPVPSTLRRRLARGIDHSLVLARGVRQVTGGRIVAAMARSHRPSQVGLPMTERKRNVAGTMRLRGRPDLAGCTVVVLDDVRTTGATMTEACRALVRGLKAQGCQPAAVWAAVLGVAAEQRPHSSGKTGQGTATVLSVQTPLEG